LYAGDPGQHGGVELKSWGTDMGPEAACFALADGMPTFDSLELGAVTRAVARYSRMHNAGRDLIDGREWPSYTSSALCSHLLLFPSSQLTLLFYSPCLLCSLRYRRLGHAHQPRRSQQTTTSP